MRNAYPGYDVMAKRDTPSWNEQTRDVINRRLALDPDAHEFFTRAEWQTLRALCARIVPADETARPSPVAATIDVKMRERVSDGYRDARLPPMAQAWRCALAALEQEALSAHGGSYHALPADLQDLMLREMQHGRLHHQAWGDLRSDVFFQHRVLVDVVSAYYAQPSAWNDIGWGGPASPRGYVRMDFDRRDPWEAAEAKAGREQQAYAENMRVGRSTAR